MALPGVEAHLAAPQRGQVVRGGAPLEVHFVILGSEVRAAPPLLEALCLPRQEGGVLGTPRRGSDVDDVARALAPVLGLDRVDDVVVPPHRVARLDPPRRRLSSPSHGPSRATRCGGTTTSSTRSSPSTGARARATSSTSEQRLGVPRTPPSCLGRHSASSRGGAALTSLPRITKWTSRGAPPRTT